MRSELNQIIAGIQRHWPEAWLYFAERDCGSTPTREEARGQARDLLSFVIRLYPEVLDDAEAIVGLHVLRELGEGYALSAQEWPIAGKERPAMPDRGSLAAALLEAGILDIDSSYEATASDRARPSVLDGLPRSPDSVERELAVEIGKWLDSYPTFAQILRTDGGRAGFFARRVERATALAVMLSRQRRQFYALTHTRIQGRAQAAMLLAILLTDSQVVAAAAERISDLETVPFIRLPFAKRLLYETGAGDWLARNDALPSALA
jgi:hypothetical protein